MSAQPHSIGLLFKAEMIRAFLAGRKHVTRRVVDLGRLAADIRGPYVRGDWPLGHRAVARGRCKVKLNPQGAVSVAAEDGSELGLKPGEFDFRCPYLPHGVTSLSVIPDGQGWLIEPHPDHPAVMWARETWGQGWVESPGDDGCEGRVHYRADESDWLGGKWTPSLLMPRWASRISRPIESVRLQRLQAITEEDAIAEGLEPCRDDHYHGWRLPNGEMALCPRHAYAELWDSINAAPKPVRDPRTKRITHYVSYPWATGARSETHRGLPHHVHGNPFVWAIRFTPHPT